MDVSPRDCALSLMRVLCCHTPFEVSTAKRISPENDAEETSPWTLPRLTNC